MKPTTLIATAASWFPAARFAEAAASAGFTVDAVCPANHPLAKAGVVRRLYEYSGLNPLRSFSKAIIASKPDLIVPGDDLATNQLHLLYTHERRNQAQPSYICQVIEHSLGSPEDFEVLYARTGFINLAREEGVRVPEAQTIHGIDELKKWIVRMGLPTVLKTDGSSGGDGVRIVRNLDAAESAFRALQAPPLLARAAKRALIDHDTKLVWPSLLRRRSTVNAQAFVNGHESNSTVACWKGEVLASLHFEVIHKTSSSGHATVVRLIDNSEMAVAVEKIARRLHLSGIHGFDFMLEAQTGNAYLIEINPRLTQVAHLTLGLERDLPAALYSAVSGNPVSPSPRITEADTIALFPQEWIRDPNSSFLRTAYHDVPWDRPELIRACVRARRKQRAWYSEQDQLQAVSLARLPRS